MIIFGGLLIIWGALVLYASLFKIKKKDLKGNAPLGSSGYIEWEFLFRILNRLPYGVMKLVVISIGASFIVIGSWMI